MICIPIQLKGRAAGNFGANTCESKCRTLCGFQADAMAKSTQASNRVLRLWNVAPCKSEARFLQALTLPPLRTRTNPPRAVDREPPGLSSRLTAIPSVCLACSSALLSSQLRVRILSPVRSPARSTSLSCGVGDGTFEGSGSQFWRESRFDGVSVIGSRFAGSSLWI
jgi:hypothetical protein